MQSLKNNPVRLCGIAAALVGALATLGVKMSPETRELVTQCLVIGLPIVAAEVARRYSWGPVTVARMQAIADKAVSK